MQKNYVVLITSKTLGDGAVELGEKLMSNYLIALSEGEVLPSHILLINTGVELVKQGEKTVNSIKMLADNGVTVLTCGTCLDYYQLKEQLAVGQVSNIYSFRDIMADADNVITLG
ncbi:sulfurtransferase-like selenium metabolism protein YedF [Desulfuribacillus alkaliarsenatis]|uniref:SirA family protein n=1 Tax=Desulfuribacillus alkaliarsenatis TaxID=766136 RepID=A0A1E5FZD2_9FIRM|nr:sulfurtransferase-like selenium metabolism protein YedF [Desulfuribacillus alkaliarsenatis]OEF95930.1 SirA family protein [Desulfuribacillus alkaliarsenatis]